MITTGIAVWLFGPQIIGFIFLVLGLIQHYFPPKKINNWYGYRTPTAQRNQQTWDEGNRYSALYMMKSGLIVLIIGMFITCVMNTIAIPVKVREALTVFLFLVSGMVPPILMIISTEKHLTNIFGKE